MKTRQAKKIVKHKIIRCRSRFGGPEDVVTGGSIDYPEQTYRKALIMLQRRMNRETEKPTKGSIDRCARINQDMNRARMALYIARAA